MVNGGVVNCGAVDGAAVNGGGATGAAGLAYALPDRAASCACPALGITTIHAFTAICTRVLGTACATRLHTGAQLLAGGRCEQAGKRAAVDAGVHVIA